MYTNSKQLSIDHTIFAWSNQKGLDPIHVEKAKGVYLYDEKGKKYIDFSSQLMNVNIGHGREEVTEAVRKQMENLSFHKLKKGFLGKHSICKSCRKKNRILNKIINMDNHSLFFLKIYKTEFLSFNFF